MKTKLVNFKTIALAAMVMISPVIGSSQGKLNDLKNKAKEKVGGEKETKTESSSGNSNSSSNSDSKTNVSLSKGIKVTASTVIMSKTIGGTTNETNFEPGDNIFLRFAFPKPVGEMYAETMGMSDVPSTGSYVIAIAKNQEDENPIIMYKANVFTSRYTKADDNTMDFILQGSEELFKKMSDQGEDVTSKYTFNSISSMSNNGLSEEWKRQTALFQVKNYEWEVMLVFVPYNSTDETKIKMMCTAKFNYNVTNENKKKISDGMNFYDKQRFEKTTDDGMTTEIHKNNVGKIVFSNEKMGKTFDDASKVKTSFSNLSGGIYSRMYLKESMRNFLAEYGQGKDVADTRYSLYFYVDGATEYACFEDSKLSQTESHSLTNWLIVFAPLNDEDFKYDVECVNRFAYVISELEPGKHTIKVIAKSQTDGDPASAKEIATGEFEITITAADRDAFVKKYGLQMPAKGLLEKDAKLLADVKIVSGKEAIDVRCPNVWEERKDAWGVVTHRVTLVAYSYKDEKGRCAQNTFMIKQPKTASGWGATNATVEEKTWYGLDPYLPCQNTK
jgi:hypothetical protein